MAIPDIPAQIKSELNALLLKIIKGIILLEAATNGAAYLAIHTQAASLLNENRDRYTFLQNNWIDPLILAGGVIFTLWGLSSKITHSLTTTLNHVDSRGAYPEVEISQLNDAGQFSKLKNIVLEIRIIQALYNCNQWLQRWDTWRSRFSFGRINRLFEVSLVTDTIVSALALASPLIANSNLIRTLLQLTLTLLAGIYNLRNYYLMRRLFLIFDEQLLKTNESAAIAAETALIVTYVNNFDWKQIRVHRLLLCAWNYAVYGATLTLTMVCIIIRLLNSQASFYVGVFAIIAGFAIAPIQGWRYEYWQQLKEAVFGSQVQSSGEGSTLQCRFEVSPFSENAWAVYTAISVDQWLTNSAITSYRGLTRIFCITAIFILTYLPAVLENYLRLPRQRRVEEYATVLMNQTTAHTSVHHHRRATSTVLPTVGSFESIATVGTLTPVPEVDEEEHSVLNQQENYGTFYRGAANHTRNYAQVSEGLVKQAHPAIVLAMHQSQADAAL